MPRPLPPLLSAALWIVALLVLPRVAVAEWGPDVKLSADAKGAMLNENMGRCLLADGEKLHVVWTDARDGDRSVYYKRSLDGGATWQPDQRLSPKPAADTYPLLALSGSTVHLVFHSDSTTPQSASYYKRSLDNGATWGPTVPLGASVFWPAVAASGSNVYVALNTVFDDDKKNSVVYVRRSLDNGATWEPQQQVSEAARRTGGRAEDPALMADGKYVHLVWNDNREVEPRQGMAVCYRRSSDQGTTWEPEQLLTHAPAYTYFPTLCLFGPHVDVAYGDRQTPPYHLNYLHSADFGKTWDAAVQFPYAPEGEFYPAILRDGDKVHVAWTGRSGIYYRRSADGGKTWDAAVKLTGEGMFPFLAVRGDAVHAIFVSKRDGNATIYYKRDPTGNR